MFIELAV